MDNIQIARLLDETAALLEIDAADPFRIRSYRRAAEAVEQQTTQLATLVAADPKQLLAIPGIGKGMAANICELVATGTMPLRAELLTKYKPTMLELLRLPGMGPKTVALVWSALGVCDIDALEAAAREGKLAELPRMGEKFATKLLKGIEDYRRNSGRFRIDRAQRAGGAHLRADSRVSRDRRDYAGGLAAARTRDGGRPGPAGDRAGLRAGGGGCGGGACGHAAADRQAAGARAEQGQLYAAQQLCRWMCGCCRGRATARRCSTSPDRRCTTSRCGSGRSSAG